MYHNNHMSEEEARVAKTTISEDMRFQRDEEFYDFFEDVYIEACRFGRIEQVCVCDNIGDHMVGHVYLKVRDREGGNRAREFLFLRTRGQGVRAGTHFSLLTLKIPLIRSSSTMRKTPLTV